MMKKEYLGDGLYARYDGNGIWLTSENGVEVLNQVYLEPEVVAVFEQYLGRLERWISAQREEEKPT